MRRAVKRSSKRARPRCRDNAESRPTAPTALVSSSTIYPVSPSSMISSTEPRLNAITGVPQAIASIITSPNGSGQSIGTTRVTDLALGPDHNAVGASHQTFRGCATVRFTGRGAVRPTLPLTGQCFDEIDTDFDPARDLQNHRNPTQCDSSNAT